MALRRKSRARSTTGDTSRSTDTASGSRTVTKKARKQVTVPGTKPANLVQTLTDPKVARRGLTIVKLVGPTVTPIAIQASVGIRKLVDQQRAQRLGVDPDRIGAYRGPTGPTAARIDGLTGSIEDLMRRRGSEPPVVRFVDAARRRLADLSNAVETAASMPSGRRRATLRAIHRDLNQIEADLLTFLVRADAP
ncbi:DUF6474 family protein [Nakamurella leprariae]|uniref:Uncharacterized protein n=1 Tax=Nakamurella leprariae TaxID=2803911 RepID=A0A938YGI9_9ACTN|nr:DUF6474 family protein [Nakamurella leprariae]MBM9469101.1 hypothetical protein [Nakamurella leprariae]